MYKGMLKLNLISIVERNGISMPDCKTDMLSRNESWSYWSGNFVWKNYRSTDKRYARDNRLMTPKSSYRWSCLAPRCRLITSWSCRRFQGLGCSPIKVVRELGLERRETVRLLSAISVRELKESDSSTRGLRKGNLWCTGCFY